MSMNIKTVDFEITPKVGIIQGQAVKLEAQLTAHARSGGSGQEVSILTSRDELDKYTFEWSVSPSGTVTKPDSNEPWKAQWVAEKPGQYRIHLIVAAKDGKNLPNDGKVSHHVDVQSRPFSADEVLTFRLASAESAQTNDDVLFQSIRE